jgi:hypothetical protein
LKPTRMYRLPRSATADPGLSSPIIASKPRPPRHWSHLRRQPSTPHTPGFLQPARSPQAPAQPSNQLSQTPYTTAKLSLLTSPAASVHLTALSPPTKAEPPTTGPSPPSPGLLLRKRLHLHKPNHLPLLQPRRCSHPRQAPTHHALHTKTSFSFLQSRSTEPSTETPRLIVSTSRI